MPSIRELFQAYLERCGAICDRHAAGNIPNRTFDQAANVNYALRVEIAKAIQELDDLQIWGDSL